MIQLASEYAKDKINVEDLYARRDELIEKAGFTPNPRAKAKGKAKAFPKAPDICIPGCRVSRRKG